MDTAYHPLTGVWVYQEAGRAFKTSKSRKGNDSTGSNSWIVLLQNQLKIKGLKYNETYLAAIKSFPSTTWYPATGSLTTKKCHMHTASRLLILTV